MKIINTGDYEHSIVIYDQRCREKNVEYSERENTAGKERYYRWEYSKWKYSRRETNLKGKYWNVIHGKIRSKEDSGESKKWNGIMRYRKKYSVR